MDFFSITKNHYYPYNCLVLALVSLPLMYFVCNDLSTATDLSMIVPVFLAGILFPGILFWGFWDGFSINWNCNLLFNTIMCGMVILFFGIELANIMGCLSAIDVIISALVDIIGTTITSRAFLSGALVGGILFVINFWFNELDWEKSKKTGISNSKV